MRKLVVVLTSVMFAATCLAQGRGGSRGSSGGGRSSGGGGFSGGRVSGGRSFSGGVSRGSGRGSGLLISAGDFGATRIEL